jgi:hypothetical protein
VLDRTWYGETVYSTSGVVEAWNQLRPSQCSDVYNVVVGGTFGENGAPDKSTPAGFAGHIGSRCAIVVHYELEGPVIDAQAYEDSVEHGRKALALVLNKLDSLRTAAGKTGKLRVWGHSKGAAIVESIWRVEARNGQKKTITSSYSVNPCPSDNCYYFGFGYPYQQELNSRFTLSHDTAEMWSYWSRGYIEKPTLDNNQWHRLTTYSNYSDPIYTCSWGCAGDLLLNNRCHLYDNLLTSTSYSDFDGWNLASELDAWRAPLWKGDVCID